MLRVVSAIPKSLRAFFTLTLNDNIEHYDTA